MTNYRFRISAVLLAVLVALVGGGLTATAAQAPALPQPPCGDTSGFDRTPLADLPPEATETYDLIRQGGPFPYPQDGTVFQNRERLLPDCSSGYYHEYTVETPGSPDRGARRIVTGEGGEYFYTRDHYASFVLIDLGGAPVPECGDLSGLDSVALSALSPAAQDVVRAAAGGADGIEYENREGVLPDCPEGYYRLFDVGSEDRVIAGDGGEIAYTPDHYRTFQSVTIPA
ncbi:ribonuclease domain-containing protein [Amycolatopsis cihanbeyliensis]|uniref:Guanyl-specific ribonuclease Sa n=1 Tax=Amycolatopsis cihanbeyliensis TaxID=1128664 RepID=A0A542DH45_AMYCI|nr:ribonuclease domain-containing protein [Amycolatopsis cihanbeyliensis]TQJ02371.1 guanyl-specific ribonuclease Sa [Amycolatopsis cihanbeyliensis]